MVLGEDKEVQEVQKLEKQLAGAIETIKKDGLTEELVNLLQKRKLKMMIMTKN